MRQPALELHDGTKPKWLSPDKPGFEYKATEPGDMVWMQFTGFRDIYGHEVYVGDIMTNNHEHPDNQEYWPVVFEQGAFWIDDSIIYDHADGDDYKLGELSICGNIYENKDMLT